jgi:uncharacterized protein YutE (UPF0331/DUF86 family)
MVNPGKVEGMLRDLESTVDQLRQIARVDRETFLEDSILAGAAKYYLQTGIETCINIGNHIIASEKYRAPKDYRDVFSVLNENGILPDDMTKTLRLMAGLRNRLVHLYWDVDDEQIYTYLRENLNDFVTFSQYVLEFVERQQ